MSQLGEADAGRAAGAGFRTESPRGGSARGDAPRINWWVDEDGRVTHSGMRDPRVDPLVSWELFLWRMAQDEPMPGEPRYGCPDGIDAGEAAALDLPA